MIISQWPDQHLSKFYLYIDLGSTILFTEKDMNIHIDKALTAIDRLK